ncbi:MAG: YvcK family protein, partial [Candidatus Omnitrophica bacterium]|nr:YvcK family protein [Candidatus Omnitrophota bacterium]
LIKGGFLQEWGLRVTADGDPTKAVSGIIPRWMDKIESMRIKDRATAEYYGNSVVAVLTEAFARVTFLESEKTLFEEYRRSRLAAAAVIDAQFVTNGKIDLVGQSMKNLMMKGMILQYKGYEDQTINPYGIIAAYKKYFETMGINVSPTPTHYEGLALKTVRQEENSLYSVTIYDQDQISHSPAFGQLPITHVEFYGARVDADVPGVQEAIEGAQIKLTGISSFVTSSAPLLMDKRIGTVLKDSTMILNANYESENIGLTIHQMTQMISRWVGQRFDAAVKVLLLNNYKQSKETLGDRIDIFKSKQLQYYGPVRWLSEKEIEAVKAENPGLTIVDEHSLVDVQEVDSRREGEAKQYILSLVDSKVARLIREANGDENLIPAAVNKQSKQISRKRGQEGFTAIEVPVAIAGIGIVVISAMNGLGWVVATIAAAAAGILMFSLLRKHFARSKHSQPSHSKLSTLSVAGVARNNNDVKVVNVGTTSSKRRKALSLALAAIELFEFIITAGFGLNNKIADNTECIDGAKESRDQKERLIQADAVSSDNGQYVTAAGTFVVADVERSSNETETVEIAASGVYSNGNDVGSWNMVPQVYDMPMAAPYTPISYADNEEVLDGATTIDLRVGNVFDLDPAQNILDDQQLQALKDLFEAVTYLSNAPPVYVTDNLSNTKGAITAFETAQIVLFNNDEDKIFIHTSVLDRIAALSSTEKETYLEFLKGVFEGHERFHAEGINDEATALLKTIEYLSENLKTLKATISVLNNPEIYGVRTEAIFKADLNDISSDGKEAIYRGNASYEHRIAKGTIVVEGDVVISDQDRYLEETDDLEGLIRKEKAKFLLVYRREVALFDKIQESLKDNPEAQGFAIGQGLYSSLEKKSKELIGEKDEQGRILSAIGAVEIGISKIFKMGEDMMKTSPNIGMTIVEFAKDLPVILSGLKNSEYLNQENGVENKDVILVMHEMTPLRIIKIAYQYNVVAIVSELGTQNAHASILARSLGLVTLTGMYLDGNIAKGSAYKNLLGGEYGIIDAHAGELIINPNEEMYAKYSDSENILKGLLQKAHRKVTSTCKTKDGAKIPISVNLDNIADSNKIVELIGKADLEGVGLLRFEFLILKIGYGDWKLVDLFAGSILGIIKQLQETAEVYGKRLKLTIRMPDKDKANIKLPNVDPTSTLEGSQWYLLSDIGRECLKVALRSTASAEKQYLETTEKPMVEVQVIFPMLNTESEAKGIKEIVDEVRAEFKEEVLANLGIMVETPQAVDELAEMIKVFGKLAVINFGSNDAEACITHTDREMGIEVGRNILNKQVIVWIAQTCAIAKIYNIPVCVCGELANFDEFALIGISLRKKGYDITGSVNPRQVAWLKYFTGFTKAAEAADLGKSINWQKESSKQISRKYSEAVLKIIESIDAADSERSENESSDPSKTLGPKGNNAGFAAVEVLAVVGATGTVVMSGWVVASVLAGVGAVITSILLIRRLLKNKLFKATIVVALFFMAVIAFAPSSAGGSTNTLTTNASEVQRQNQNIDIHPVYAIHISKECFELVSEHLDNLFGEAKDNGQKLKIYIENNLLMPGYAVESFNAYFPGMNPKQLVDSKEYQFAFEPFLTAQHSKSQENMDMILQAFVSGNVDGLDFELNGYYRAMMTYLARKKNEGYSFDVVSEKPSLEYMVSELDRVIYGHVDYDWKAINQLRGRKLAKDVIEDLAMDANTRVIILMGYMHQPMTEVLKTTGYPVNPYIEDKVVEYAVAQEKVLTVSQDSDEFYKISQAYKSIARELNVHLDAIDREIVVFEIKHSIRSAVKSAADHWVGFILAMLAFAGSLLVVKRTFTMRKKYSGKGNKQDPGSDLEAYPVAVPMKVVLGSGRQRTVAKAVLVNGLRGQEYRIQYVSGDSFVVGQESTLQHRINTVLDDVKERGVPSLPSQFGIVITDSVKATEKHIMTYNRTQNILFIHTWYFNVVNKKKAVHLVSDIDRHEILGHILLGLDEEEARKLSFEYFGERLSMLKYFLEYMEDLKDYGVELDDDYAVKLEEIAKAGHAWMLVGRDLSDRLQQEIDSFFAKFIAEKKGEELKPYLMERLMKFVNMHPRLWWVEAASWTTMINTIFVKHTSLNDAAKLKAFATNLRLILDLSHNIHQVLVNQVMPELANAGLEGLYIDRVKFVYDPLFRSSVDYVRDEFGRPMLILNITYFEDEDVYSALSGLRYMAFFRMVEHAQNENEGSMAKSQAAFGEVIEDNDFYGVAFDRGILREQDRSAIDNRLAKTIAAVVADALSYDKTIRDAGYKQRLRRGFEKCREEVGVSHVLRIAARVAMGEMIGYPQDDKDLIALKGYVKLEDMGYYKALKSEFKKYIAAVQIKRGLLVTEISTEKFNDLYNSASNKRVVYSRAGLIAVDEGLDPSERAALLVYGQMLYEYHEIYNRLPGVVTEAIEMFRKEAASTQILEETIRLAGAQDPKKRLEDLNKGQFDNVALQGVTEIHKFKTSEQIKEEIETYFAKDENTIGCFIIKYVPGGLAIFEIFHPYSDANKNIQYTLRGMIEKKADGSYAIVFQGFDTRDPARFMKHHGWTGDFTSHDLIEVTHNEIIMAARRFIAAGLSPITNTNMLYKTISDTVESARGWTLIDLARSRIERDWMFPLDVNPDFVAYSDVFALGQVLAQYNYSKHKLDNNVVADEESKNYVALFESMSSFARAKLFASFALYGISHETAVPTSEEAVVVEMARLIRLEGTIETGHLTARDHKNIAKASRLHEEITGQPHREIRENIRFLRAPPESKYDAFWVSDVDTIYIYIKETASVEDVLHELFAALNKTSHSINQILASAGLPVFIRRFIFSHIKFNNSAIDHAVDKIRPIDPTEPSRSLNRNDRRFVVVPRRMKKEDKPEEEAPAAVQVTISQEAMIASELNKKGSVVLKRGSKTGVYNKTGKVEEEVVGVEQGEKTEDENASKKDLRPKNNGGFALIELLMIIATASIGLVSLFFITGCENQQEVAKNLELWQIVLVYVGTFALISYAGAHKDQKAPKKKEKKSFTQLDRERQQKINENIKHWMIFIAVGIFTFFVGSPEALANNPEVNVAIPASLNSAAFSIADAVDTVTLTMAGIVGMIGISKKGKVITDDPEFEIEQIGEADIDEWFTKTRELSRELFEELIDPTDWGYKVVHNGKIVAIMMLKEDEGDRDGIIISFIEVDGSKQYRRQGIGAQLVKYAVYDSMR